MDKNVTSVLWMPTADRIVLGVGAPAVFGAAGFFLPRVSSWVMTLSWFPWRGLFDRVASWSGWWVPFGFLAVGVLLGIVFVAFAFYETARVAVTDSDVRVTVDGESATVSRSAVAAVFVDGKELVVLDSTSRQIVRLRTEEKPDVVRQVFADHGYPVAESDPYETLYRRWVLDYPGLAAEVNAVMRAREMALKKKSKSDAAELLEELNKLGIVVRDSKTSQYWRPLVRT